MTSGLVVSLFVIGVLIVQLLFSIDILLHAKRQNETINKNKETQP